MMDFDRHLEKLALIGGNATLILALAVASISFTESAPGARTARYPDGWRAPQQAQASSPRAAADVGVAWARPWVENR